MKTYWQVEVSVDGVCKMSTGGETISQAIEKALGDAIYYQAIYPSGRVVIGGLKEQCGKCWNAGRLNIRRPRSWKWIKCPECKGKCPAGTAPDIYLNMPDAANRIVLRQEVA